MEEQRRRWFQLSLTTCIVLMVVAAVLVWVNVRPPHVSEIKVEEDGATWARVHGPGWPGRSYEAGIWAIPPRTLADELESMHRYEPAAVLINICVALLLLALTACLTEWLIRRRGRSRQEAKA